MKKNVSLLLASALCATTVSAQDGLYSVGIDAEDSLPLQWVVGLSTIYDDNVGAGNGNGFAGATEEDSLALNPSLAVSFVNISPQTTWDVFARLGTIYYFDAPGNMDDWNSQSRIGVNLTHRFSERLRYVSRNFVSYELEPDYAFGFAAARTAGEYFFWNTDQSIGYRWSERVGTYTGFSLTGTNFTDVEGNDRMNWSFYNQFRYQLSPQTVLTADYRYGATTGSDGSSDSSDQFVTGGIEHRFSPTSVGILRVGAQFRDVDDGSSNTSPFLEFAFRTQMNDKFSIRSFVRYGMEYFDTVQSLPQGGILYPVEYDDRRTLRIGVSSEYIISPRMSLIAGVDYIPTQFKSGRVLPGSGYIGAPPDADEDLINANIGLNVRFTDFITGTLAYNFTNSSSDFIYRDYDRNRVSLGVTAQF